MPLSLKDLFSTSPRKQETTPAPVNNGGASGGTNANAQNQTKQQKDLQFSQDLGANPNANSNANNDRSGNNGANSRNTDGGESGKSPLDEFSTLFKNSENSDGEEAQNNGNLFNPNMEELGKAVAQMDFTKNLDPALVESALKGDSKAFSQVINQAAQGAFGRALITSSQLVEAGVKKRMESLTKDIDARFKKLGTSEKLRAQNAAFSHPAVAPVVELIQDKFAAAHPNASTEELRNHATKYLTNLAQTILGKSDGESGNTKSEEGKLSNGDQDFTKFFEGSGASEAETLLR